MRNIFSRTALAAFTIAAGLLSSGCLNEEIPFLELGYEKLDIPGTLSHAKGGESGTDLSYGNSTSYQWSISSNSVANTFKLAGVISLSAWIFLMTADSWCWLFLINTTLR